MQTFELLQGEFVEGQPPLTRLANGESCVPQHYLLYQHNLQSIEALILNISYDDHYPIFVSEDEKGIYLQVGIIGQDNYAPAQVVQNKIVYGRKWRVESNLPTSEIVQTALLAVKTAREHEIREQFRLKVDNKITTPFNNHHDLPLLAKSLQIQPEVQETETWAQLQSQLDAVNYAGVEFYLGVCQKLTGSSYLVELELLGSPSECLPELKQLEHLGLILNNLTFNELVFELMSALIQLSNRHVEEHFCFNDVARFSRRYAIKDIAALSAKTRHLHESHPDFKLQWRQNNYETDVTRAPNITSDKLATKIQRQLLGFAPLGGIMPTLASSQNKSN